MQYIITTYIKTCAEHKCKGQSYTTFGIFPTEKRAKNFMKDRDVFTKEMRKNAQILPLNIMGSYSCRQVARMFSANAR